MSFYGENQPIPALPNFFLAICPTGAGIVDLSAIVEDAVGIVFHELSCSLHGLRRGLVPANGWLQLLRMKRRAPNNFD
jgi:hypothetical protein